MCQHFLFGTNLTDHEDLSHVSFNISTCYSPQNFRICVFRKAPEKRFKICHIFGRKITPIVLLQWMPTQTRASTVRNSKQLEVKNKKKLFGFSYSKNMANFDMFLWNFSSSTNPQIVRCDVIYIIGIWERSDHS